MRHKTEPFTGTGMLIGYARVSTLEQTLDSQMDGLREAGCERIYEDRVTGISAARPGLDRLREALRRGDTLAVWRLDRLGRSLSDLIKWAGWLHEHGVGFRSLHEQIDTSNSTGRLVFHMFGALAEFEHNLIRERTLSGLKAARARGRQGGRPKKLTLAQRDQVLAMHRDHSLGVGEICQTMGICRSTLYRYLRNG